MNTIDPNGLNLQFPMWWSDDAPWQGCVLNNTRDDLHGDWYWDCPSQGGVITGGGGTDDGGVVITDRIVPVPDNLRARLRKMLQGNNKECDDYVRDLINQAAFDSGINPASQDSLELFDDVTDPTTGGGIVFGYGIFVGNLAQAGGTVGGTIGNNPTVYVKPRTLPDWAFNQSVNVDFAQTGYIETILHELIHLSAQNTYYDDIQLAQAAFHLGGLTQAERDAYDQIIPGSVASNSAWWDTVLSRHCK